MCILICVLYVSIGLDLILMANIFVNEGKSMKEPVVRLYYMQHCTHGSGTEMPSFLWQHVHNHQARQKNLHSTGQKGPKKQKLSQVLNKCHVSFLCGEIESKPIYLTQKLSYCSYSVDLVFKELLKSPI